MNNKQILPDDTPVGQVNDIIDQVASKADDWKAVPVTEKVALLQSIIRNARDCHHEWMELSGAGRKIDPNLASQQQGCGEADVQISGPAMFGAYANGILKSLQCVVKTGRAPKPRSVRPLGTDHCAVRLYPDGSLLDLTETVGLQGELVLKGSQPTQLSYEEYATGGVAGVLGAGNYDVPCDLLTQVFLKGRVCVHKPNPVQAATIPIMQLIFEPLISKGYVAFVVGGAEVGTALVQHSKLTEIVMTGSVATYEKIKPLTNTPITAELGAVNPWIVVPGKKWNERTVNNHARSLAWAKMVNNGHVCAAPQVVILDQNWKFRSLFVERLQYWLKQYAGSPPFYPNVEATHQHFAAMNNAQVLHSKTGSAFDNQQHCVFFDNLDSEDVEATHDILTREAFCPVLAVMTLDIDEDKDDPVHFLQAAVNYAESNLFGSLTATILMDDATTKLPTVNDIVANMKYGIVGINMVPAFGYSLPHLVWGAFPGAPQSGQGFLGNCHFYDQPQKAILRAPFGWIGRRLVSVVPPARAAKVFRRMAAYKLKPNLMTQTMLFSALFLGL